MEEMKSIIPLLVGLFLRLGIPILISFIVFFLLKRLDNRWQNEIINLPINNKNQRPCWEVKNCKDEMRKQCPASSQPEVPCWQLFRAKSGILKENCLECQVFRSAWLSS